MASTILSDNGVSSGSAGIKTSADSTGALALQTTTAGGTATTAVTIDTSQNVGIGTSAPTEKCHIYASSGNAFYRFQNSATGSGASDGGFMGIGGSGDVFLYNYEASNIIFATNNAERARIDSSGNLLVRTTSQAGANVLTIKSSGATGAGNGIAVVKSDTTDYWSQNTDSLVGYTFGKNGSDFWYAGRSGSNNCVSSNGSWVNSSDVRLKENVLTLTNALEKVCKLRGVEFDRKNNGTHEIGLIAQEVQEIYPNAVEDNGEFLGLNYGSLVGPLVEAIKEQQALITTLTERITALESK